MQENITKNIRIDTLIQEVYWNGLGKFVQVPNKMTMTEDDLLELSDETGLVNAELLINLYNNYVTTDKPFFKFKNHKIKIISVADAIDPNDPKPHTIQLKVIKNAK